MEQLDVLVHEQSKGKQNESHRVAAEIVAGIIRGSKHWTLEMVIILYRLVISMREPFSLA